MSKKVIITGGLGNGTAIAYAMLDAFQKGHTEWEFVGFLNDRDKGDIQGFPVLGTLDDARKYLDEGYYFINVILRIDGQKERLNRFESQQIPDSRMATFVHPTAYVAPNVTLEPGCAIMPIVTISPGALLKRGTLVMVSATIGHDTTIGEYSHIAAQSCVGAYLKIGRGVHIGLNSTIRENLTIGDYATLGMGSVLTKNIGEGEIWVGNPARFLRKAE